MNAKPHTHEVKFGRQDFNLCAHLEPGYWTVTYGDTTIRVHRGPWFAHRLTKATQRAVRKHDWGSIRAGEAEDRADRLKAAAIAAARSDWVKP